MSIDRPGPPRRAAQYLRMSRERQNYSLEYQTAHNAAFALAQGYELVRTYTDAAVSGLRLKGRDGLKQLLADVTGGAPGFTAVLVYDVSRWGRFQDPDQAAHYEFICREAGVEIVYTAETFNNDGSLSSTLLKHLKRAMAAEFSRDLSLKTARAQRGLAEIGFWVNGPPGYGFRRLAVAADKHPILPMEWGEQKALRGQRTLLVLGPEAELLTIRRIYSLFVVGGMRITAIARLLHSEGLTAEGGARWTGLRVRQILTSEKYAGALLHNKSMGALGIRRTLPRAAWIRVPGAVAPIVSQGMFAAAQAQFRRPKSRNPTDAELLDDLRTVLRDHGRVSVSLINAHPGTHCAAVIARRFGGLLNAMALVGATPSPRQAVAAAKARRQGAGQFRNHREPIDPASAFDALRRHLASRGTVSSNTINEDPDLPSADWYRRHYGTMALIYELLGYEPSARQKRHMKLGRAHPHNPAGV